MTSLASAAAVYSQPELDLIRVVKDAKDYEVVFLPNGKRVQIIDMEDRRGPGGKRRFVRTGAPGTGAFCAAYSLGLDPYEPVVNAVIQASGVAEGDIPVDSSFWQEVADKFDMDINIRLQRLPNKAGIQYPLDATSPLRRIKSRSSVITGIEREVLLEPSETLRDIDGSSFEISGHYTPLIPIEDVERIVKQSNLVGAGMGAPYRAPSSASAIAAFESSERRESEERARRETLCRQEYFNLKKAGNYREALNLIQPRGKAFCYFSASEVQKETEELAALGANL